MARFLFLSVYSLPYLYQVDYKVLAERLAKKLEDHGNENLLLTLRMTLTDHNLECLIFFYRHQIQIREARISQRNPTP